MACVVRYSPRARTGSADARLRADVLVSDTEPTVAGSWQMAAAAEAIVRGCEECSLCEVGVRRLGLQCWGGRLFMLEANEEGDLLIN